MLRDDDVDLAVQRFAIGALVWPAVPVGQAWSNEVYRVETTTGAYALKLYPPEMTDGRRQQLAAGLAFEQSVLQTALVPVPRPVVVGDRWLVELDTPAGRRSARCHRWVAGAPATPPLGARAVREAGRYLGLLHAMHQPGGDTAGLPPFDAGRWERAVHGATAQRLPWSEELAGLTPLVRSLAADLEVLREQRRPMRNSHRDYDPKNAVVAAAGHLVIADWDHAGPVLPDVELIVAATSWASSDAALLTFFDAYRGAGGDAGVSDQLALTAELADADWLLRNVETCLAGGPLSTRDQDRIASELITGFASGVARLRAWPDRLTGLLRRGAS